MGWNHDLMFSDGQTLSGTSAVLSTQSIPLTPLQDMNGRNIGVGTPLFVEVYGTMTGGTGSGTFLIELVTTTDEALTGSLVILDTNRGIGLSVAATIPNLGVTIDGTSAALWKWPLPIFTDYKAYLGLRYTCSVDMTNKLSIVAGITMVPTSLRAVGSGMNFVS